jgi:hypothetical protein
MSNFLIQPRFDHDHNPESKILMTSKIDQDKNPNVASKKTS